MNNELQQLGDQITYMTTMFGEITQKFQYLISTVQQQPANGQYFHGSYQSNGYYYPSSFYPQQQQFVNNQNPALGPNAYPYNSAVPPPPPLFQTQSNQLPTLNYYQYNENLAYPSQPQVQNGQFSNPSSASNNQNDVQQPLPSYDVPNYTTLQTVQNQTDFTPNQFCNTQNSQSTPQQIDQSEEEQEEGEEEEVSISTIDSSLEHQTENPSSSSSLVNDHDYHALEHIESEQVNDNEWLFADTDIESNESGATQISTLPNSETETTVEKNYVELLPSK